jgi:DNA-binding MarR family transcriptional regulator
VAGRPLSYAAVSVLHAVASGVRYGFDIMDRTALPSGTVYPALSRLERDGYVRTSKGPTAIAGRRGATTASRRRASGCSPPPSSGSAR